MHDKRFQEQASWVLLPPVLTASQADAFQVSYVDSAESYVSVCVCDLNATAGSGVGAGAIHTMLAQPNKAARVFCHQ